MGVAKKFLISDLDNTLYDWVNYFVPSFYAMVAVASERMEIPTEQLLDELREVHQRHHNSEHPFSLLETNSARNLKLKLGEDAFSEIIDPAFRAFNKTRKDTLHLYEGVLDTLKYLRSIRVQVVGHTDSRLYAVLDRVHRLGLGDYFSRIYCGSRSESSHPHPLNAQEWLTNRPTELAVELSHHQLKPNPDVLLEICAREGFSPEHTIYVGDSLVKDVFMAKKAGVFAAWAAYGTAHNAALYEKLVRVTHWSQEDVVREKLWKSEAEGAQPDVVLARFSDLVSYFID